MSMMNGAASELLSEIRKTSDRFSRPVRIMEVCGTHTVSIFRAGIRQLLPPNIELVSGPGCPVCVTPTSYIDTAVAYAKESDVIIATFGDMLKVPGSVSSLSAEPGADIRVIYSPLDALDIADKNPSKKIIFLAVGFETTAPTTAAAVLEAKRRGISNFFVLTAQRLVPPAIRALLSDSEMRVDGFLLPGHVAVVTGLGPFRFLAEEYNIPGVVAGFSPEELLRAILCAARQLVSKTARVENEYESVVRPEGNPAAREILSSVYEETDADWRGLGLIKKSGLSVNESFRRFDILFSFPLEVAPPISSDQKSACRCGEVLQGKISPRECRLFGTACIPEHAAGPCMVSVEGVCAAWYKYGGGAFRFGK